MPAVTRTATFWIAVLTALVSTLAMALLAVLLAPLSLGFVPARLSGLAFPFATVPVFLTPLTATLVHGGALHLGFNLLMLVWCGLAVERVLGTGGLLSVYGVSAYAAMAAQWAVDPFGLSPVIGASGAISGVIGAYALSFGRPRRISANPRVNRFVHILWLAAAWTVLQLLVGFTAGAQAMMLATPALAQQSGHQGMNHQGMNHSQMMQPTAANPYGPAEMDMHQKMMAASGADVSQTYMRKMLEHHKGAVAMSDVALANGVTGTLRSQIQKTRADQQKEIAMVEAMLRGEPMQSAMQQSGAKTAAQAKAEPAPADTAKAEPKDKPKATSAARPAEPKASATPPAKAEPASAAPTCAPEHRAAGHC